MRSIHVKGVKKSRDGSLVLSDINLTIPGGQFFALLGPSGCGKTTLLRLIGGFEDPDEGSIYLGDEDITYKPIHQRKVNIVFQSYALFPHLSVFENIAYSLRVNKTPNSIVQQKVYRLLDSFGLEKQAMKLPEELSGGQQQRVALARAIINEPDVLLLDEPLAALDYKLREKMLLELIELQDKLSTTFVYVTHDQDEALTVADQMAIMNHEGDIEQIGTPEEIYEFPKSSFVARFVGSTNIFHGKLAMHQGLKFVDDTLGHLEIKHQEKAWMEHDTSAVMSIRPEKIFISKSPMENFSNMIKGFVHQIAYYGRSTLYRVNVNGKMIQVFEQNEEHFPKETIDYDDEVYLYWQKENVVLLET